MKRVPLLSVIHGTLLGDTIWLHEHSHLEGIKLVFYGGLIRGNQTVELQH